MFGVLRRRTLKGPIRRLSFRSILPLNFVEARASLGSLESVRGRLFEKYASTPRITRVALIYRALTKRNRSSLPKRTRRLSRLMSFTRLNGSL